MTLHGFDKSGTETGIVFCRHDRDRPGCERPDSRPHPASGHSIAVLVLLRSQPAGAGPVSGRTAALFQPPAPLPRRYPVDLQPDLPVPEKWRSSKHARTSAAVSASDLFSILQSTQRLSALPGISGTAYASLYVVYLLTGLTVLVFLLFNLWIFYILFRQAIEQESIRDAVQQLSTGETSYQLNLDEFDGPELTLAEGLNNISSGLETALQEKMKSERLKTNLITNVSHDIKTPLTSIINYVNLMKREHIEDARINAYLDVLDQKSQRLKTLIEDLVEASKASSGNVKLEFTDIDLVQMAFQTNGEFEEKLDARHLQLIINAPREPLMIRADGRRLWRVLENLYNNVCKYAMEGSRVYVDLARVPGNPETGTAGQAVFTIKNISANPLNIRADELTERFVRGDVARTTEGSGLGLSIAKDLTELQKGQFSLYIDGDLFKAQVTFDLVEKTTEKTVEDAEIIEETDASEAAEKPKKDDELKKTNIPEEATIQKEVNGESSENAINETINTTENSRNE